MNTTVYKKHELCQLGIKMKVLLKIYKNKETSFHLLLFD